MPPRPSTTGKPSRPPRVSRRLIEPRLAQGLVEPALHRRIAEAGAEAGEIEIGVLALALLQRVRRLGVAAELGIGTRQRNIERWIGRIATTRRLAQRHRIRVAA